MAQFQLCFRTVPETVLRCLPPVSTFERQPAGRKSLMKAAQDCCKLCHLFLTSECGGTPMEEQISNRHESDLGGRFLPFGDTNQVHVTVVVPSDTAHLPAVQHTAWMLLNLLARQQGVVQQIGLSCPPSIPLAGRIVPFAPRNLDLRLALLAGCDAIGIVPVSSNSVGGRVLIVGSNRSDDADLYVHGDGWCGGVMTAPITPYLQTSALPFGPYIAACLAAAEIFKAARLKPESYVPVQSAIFSAWGLQTSTSAIDEGPKAISVAPNFALAGVGAVGCAFLHTLWACTGFHGLAILADNDRKFLENTNLNRYVLFGRASVGHPKATEAARLIADSECTFDPRDIAIQELSAFPNLVVSAVDQNISRAAIQNRYPSLILSGSTKDLRAEILRCGPPGTGACLRCYNPPEVILSDDDIRATIHKQSDDEIAKYTDAIGITVEEARQWADKGQCGMAGERVLSHIRAQEDEPREFAVGFVSVMAGTLLFAQLVKECMDSSVPLSDDTNRSVFQFWSSTSGRNKPSPLARDPQCPMCKPDAPATKIWSERFYDRSRGRGG
ncbi:MAG TPA: ThiF family adenylyltransferase [Pirellulales bacterium]|jgi:molybdopterin/thiamine biosynthesis adenylyltransferase|nr:ThiF family adenylyltransferase [Pirellulales bacterium]